MRSDEGKKIMDFTPLNLSRLKNVRLLTERSSEFFGVDLFSVVSMQRMNLEVSRDSIDLKCYMTDIVDPKKEFFVCMEFTDGECLITGIEIKSIIFHEKCHEVNLTTTKGASVAYTSFYRSVNEDSCIETEVSYRYEFKD